MGFHHVAIAVKDAKATHEFYTGPMGFRLAKVEVGRAGEGGFAKHLFYDTGEGGMIAFWDLHDPALPENWSAAISDGLGLPRWANHIAFQARDLDDLAARLKRWIDFGLDCWEIDHGWCRSIYTNDPNEILVEFCVSTRALTRADAEQALALLAEESPTPGTPPPITVHRAARRR
jgi:catechol 2,3-dioxygenase-like lactoylglutathione lyase family enzyme